MTGNSKAISLGQEAEFNLLCEKFKNSLNVNEKDGLQITALQQAAFTGNLNFIKKLIDLGAEVNSKQGELFPLHIAVWTGHYEAAEELLSRGANVNAICGKYPEVECEHHKLSPLHIAAIKGNTALIALLSYYNADYTALTLEQKNAEEIFYDNHGQKKFKLGSNRVSAKEAFSESTSIGKKARDTYIDSYCGRLTSAIGTGQHAEAQAILQSFAEDTQHPAQHKKAILEKYKKEGYTLANDTPSSSSQVPESNEVNLSIRRPAIFRP